MLATKRELSQPTIPTFLKRRTVPSATNAIDISMYPWLLPKIASFLPRAARDELRCCSRSMYRAMTEVPGLTIWHKRVVTHDVYHVPLELMRLVINIFKLVSESRYGFKDIDNDFISYDAFELMDFSNLEHLANDTVQIFIQNSHVWVTRFPNPDSSFAEIINACYDLLSKYNYNSWSLILLFIIDDAKRHGMYHNIFIDSSYDEFLCAS